VGSTIRSPKRVGAIVVGVMLLIAASGAFWAWRPWDARMGSGPAARALQVRLHAKQPYRCEPADVNAPLKNADYFCAPTGSSGLAGYWVATDRNHITEIQPAG
jgi:hypothetical protein